MTRYQFPEGFWGAAASGPANGRISNKPHRSIWDSWFAEQPERFISRLDRKPFATPIISIPRTWR